MLSESEIKKGRDTRPGLTTPTLTKTYGLLVSINVAI